MNLNQITVPALDLVASTTFYEALGLRKIVDSPHYVRFECPVGEATLSLSQSEEKSHGDVTLYFEHEALDQWVNELIALGLSFDQLPKDESYLWREARLRDPAGNSIILYWAGKNRKYPPWRSEAPTAAKKQPR